MESLIFHEIFNMAGYNISHKVLLLRNEDPERVKSNIDIIFEGVFYLEIPTRLNGIAISDGGARENAYVLNKFNGKIYPEYGQRVFVIKSEGFEYLIGCVRYLIK